MSESVLLVSVLRSKFDVLVLFGEIFGVGIHDFFSWWCRMKFSIEVRSSQDWNEG